MIRCLYQLYRIYGRSGVKSRSIIFLTNTQFLRSEENLILFVQVVLSNIFDIFTPIPGEMIQI